MQVPPPDLVRVQAGPEGSWSAPGAIEVSCTPLGDGLAVDVTAGLVSRVHLRWHRTWAPHVQILGDAWERGYGDLGWAAMAAEVVHPWMVLAHSPTHGTWGAGVDVAGSSFAGWSIDPRGVSLWLDLRAGSGPVRLDGRQLRAAVVRWVTGDDPYRTQCTLAGSVSPNPLPVGPLVGANNWYYAYGKGFGVDAVLRDARYVSELTAGHPVRPFMVVDDGWTPDGMADGRHASGGPWDRGRADFAQMSEVAAAITAEDARPGLWFRPLLSRVPHPGAGRPWDGGWALDPSHPATIATVSEDVARFAGWGYELVKHDFSTFEALGRWGFQMGPRPCGPGIAPYDTTRTTAEVLVGLYDAIARSAGDALVLGCNAVGHLAAGKVHAQRVGDDTSGHVWERTRRMGVNSLAFRLAQHGRFFTVDADCVPSTPDTDWAKNRQLLDLVARSGTALFVSVDPRTYSDAVSDDLAAALKLALDGGIPGGVEPLDWLTTTSPAVWRSGDEVVTFDWFPAEGADVYDVGGVPYQG